MVLPHKIATLLYCFNERDEILLLERAQELRRANYMVLNFMNYGRPLKLRRSSVPYGEIIARVLPLLDDPAMVERLERIRARHDATSDEGRP